VGPRVWTGVENVACIRIRSLGRPGLSESLYPASCQVPFICSRSQLPGGLRRGSSVARLLRLRVRILPVAWMAVVISVCCQVEVSATVRSFDLRSSAECVSFGVIKYNSSPLHLH
jgi:hypothetical protein